MDKFVVFYKHRPILPLAAQNFVNLPLTEVKEKNERQCNSLIINK